MSFFILLLGAGAGAVITLAVQRVRARGDVPGRLSWGAGPGAGGGVGVRAAGALPRDGAAAAAPLTAAREDVRRALESARVRLAARRALLWDVDALHGVARVSVVTSGDRPPEIRLEGDPLGWAIEQALPLRLTEPQRWSRGGNGCAIPLRRDGSGALVTFEFDVEVDLPEPETLATWGGYLDAFARAEVYQTEARRDRERASALLDVLQRLPDSQHLQAFGNELTEAARRLGQVDGAAFARWHEDEGQVLAIAADGGAPPVGVRFREAASVFGLVPHANGVAVREHRREEAHRLPVLAPGERWPVDPRAAAAFPLRTGAGGINAVLGIWSTAEATFDPRAIPELEALAAYASPHLTQLLAYDAAREDSVRDRLTGLLNRRGLEERLAEEAARAMRYGRPLALAMLDIDHFKVINDTHGHDGGDAVLRALGALLTATVRDNDYSARIGGEEFLVLLVETSLEAAADTAERLRARIQAMEVPWKGGRIPVTASFGVSAMPDCVAEASALMRSADEALYASKHGGRNRVTIALHAHR